MVGQGAGGDAVHFKEADGDDAGAPQRIQGGSGVKMFKNCDVRFSCSRR